MNDPSINDFFEAINGILVGIHVGILIIFMRYIYDGARMLDWDLRATYFARRAAISVAIFIFGGFIIRAFVWTLRHYENTRGVSAPLDMVWRTQLGVAVGVLISIAGGICILRHFSPVKAGAWPWVLTVVLSLVFGVGLVVAY